MKKHQICFAIVFLVILSLTTHSAAADILYEEEYKILHSVNTWHQVSGYENVSYSSQYQELLKVVNYTDENITYMHIYGSAMQIVTYNYSIHELLPWVGPIGWDFINPTQMAYYYDLWLNQENITEVYSNIIGVGFTTDERYAENYVFKANLSIDVEDERVDFFYDQDEEITETIYDDYTFSVQIYVEYDISGVILKWLENLVIDGTIVQLKRDVARVRVNEFSDLEITKETNLTGLLFSLTAILAMMVISKKYSSKQI